jgi:CheY-like chemotaxis protein
MMSKLGYETLLSTNSRDALDVFKKNKDKIDMVLLDMIMPGMGGSELYDRLKDINPDIKVLLLSGYGIDGQATEILRKGCNGFIQKPFDLLTLSEKITEVLEF